jgi:N-methylhydantoinase A
LAGKLSVAARRRLTAIEAAQGIIDVVNVNMERALRHVSVERGHDPRGFVLVPFGGAGGLHAVDLARGLRIPRVILPAHPGALSAIGIVAANVVQEQSRTVMLEVNSGTGRKLELVFREMQRSARVTLKREGFSETRQRHEQRLAMRYKGQSFELEIEPAAGDLAAAFHRAHLQRYDYAQEDNAVEIVSARLRSLGLVAELKIERAKAGHGKHSQPAAYVDGFLDGKPTRAGVYQRDQLPPGAILRTPCIVAEYSATTLIPARAKGILDEFGNLVIDV